MNKLELQVILNAVDKLSAPIRAGLKQTEALAKSLENTKKNLRALESTQGKMDLWKKHKKELGDYDKTLDNHKNKLAELKKAHESAKATKAEYKPQLTSMRREVTNLRNRYSNSIGKGIKNDQLFVQYQKQNEALIKMSAHYDKLKSKVQSAKKSIYDEERALKHSKKAKIEKIQSTRKLWHEINKLGIKNKTFAESEKNIQLSVDKATAAIKKQQAALNKSNHLKVLDDQYRAQVQSLKDKSDKMASFGQKTFITGAATIGILAKPTKEFADAERAATNLKVAMMDKDGNVSESYEKINKLAADLGNRLPGTTADFKDLMTMLVRQGMSVETILGGTGEAAAYLAVQLEMPPKQAAEFAAKMQDATRTTEADMMGLMDVIQKGFYSGVDPVNMLGAFKNLGSAMDTIKIKGLEGAKALAPFVAMFDQAGMDGSASGNAMRKVLQKGMKTADIRAKLNKLRKKGFLSKKIDIDFTDGKGEFGGFEHMYKELEKIKNLNTAERLKVIEGIFGNDAEVNQVLSTLIEKGKAGYEEFAAKMEKQADLRRRVDEQLGTLANIWEAATGTFTNLLVQIGETYAPQLKALIEQFGILIEKVMSWVNNNPELVGSFAKWIAITGGAMIAIGGLSTVLSYTLYPVARLGLGLGKLTGINKLFAESFKESGKTVLQANSHLLSIKGWGSILNAGKSGVSKLVLSITTLFGKMKHLSFWLKIVFSPIRLLFMGVGTAISFLLSPIGIVVAALVSAGILIYRNWEKVRSFFSGFWEGLKSGLAPVIEKFKPLGDLFGVVVGWIEKAVKWFTDLLSPVQSTQKDLDSAASAGKKFGEWVAKGIELALTPLNLLMDGIKWVINNMPSIEKFAKEYGNKIDNTAKMAANTGFSSGGYVGNGGKYQPMGIVHGGEYVITKEATARLGVPLLNALNYGKKAAAVSMLGAGVATAAPVKVDSRPPLVPRSVVVQQAQQPMTVNININAAAGQDERTIARLVAQEIQRVQQQRQARMRSRMTDNE